MTNLPDADYEVLPLLGHNRPSLDEVAE